MTNWLLVSSAENFETSRTRGFDIAGMKSRHRKKAERVAPGDRVLFYLTVVKSIGGAAEVTGPFFEDDEPIWESNKPGEIYPFRFPIKLLTGAGKRRLPADGRVWCIRWTIPNAGRRSTGHWRFKAMSMS